LTVSLFKSNINSDTFYAWITQDLLPRLGENSVLIMDNAAFHKRKDVRDAIINHNIILEYLPAYSPDLNPIEKKWAQVKLVRQKNQYPVESLFNIHF
jgi:transposase